MINYSQDIEYGLDRLYMSICTLEGKPCYIQAMGNREGEIVVIGSEVNTGRSLTSTIDQLDTNPVHIGYLYIGSYDSKYVVRSPHRQWKQGLRNTFLHILPGGLTLDSAYVGTQGFVDSYLNKYPRFKECEEALVKNSIGMPFHKEYTLCSDGGVYSRAVKVGVYNPHKNGLDPISLDSEYKYLADELKEVMDEAL